jgi:tetratricopeptide (TPR) repeat protein
VTSEDTTVLPGLMETGNEDETSSGGFGDAPTTAPAAATLPQGARPDDSADLDAEVDVEVFVGSLSKAPSSGAYATLERPNHMFGTAPEPEAPATALFPPLPEMSPEIWQAGVRALVTVTDTIEPPWSDEDYWRELGGLLVDEAGLTDDPARRLELTLSAARVAERLGDAPMSLRLVDDALSMAPEAPAAWRARGRLFEAAGDVDGAHEAWRRMRALTADADERAVYTALDGEWTLARRGSLDGLEGPSLSAIPDGPARALAEAEIALLQGTPAEVAGALEQAAFGTGGPVGAALLEAAARFHEVGGDSATAAEQRFVAARMDAGSAAPPLGRLRDAARAAPEEVEALLAELQAELGSSALGDAVARWEASLARARGDAPTARRILAEAAGPSPSTALLRDRLDLDLEVGEPPDEETMARARAAATSPTAAAAVALVEATSLAARGDLGDSLGRLADVLSLVPDALPLGLLAEDIARATDDPSLRVAALEQWLRVDAGRRASAALALADAVDARGGEGSELEARAALQTVIETAPGAAAFWTTAARDVRAGRVGDAAATLGYGAELWSRSRLGAPLAERAAELTALTSADAALPELHALATPGPSELERLLTIARGASRAGASADRLAWLTDHVGILTDVQTRAWWWIRRAQALQPGAGDERLACLDAALEKAPSHPVALALLLGDPLASPARISTALASAGTVSDWPALRVAAVHTAALGGEAQQASDLAGELCDAQPGSMAVVELAVEQARARGAAGPSGTSAPAHPASTPLASLGLAEAAAIVARLPLDQRDDARTLRVAEALELGGQPARAAEMLAKAPTGLLAPDVRRAVARLGVQSPGAGLPLARFAGPADAAAQATDEALGRLRRAAEQGRAQEIVWVLEHEPPHEPPGGDDTIFTAALVEEGQGGPHATELFQLASGAAGAPPRLSALTRVAESVAGAPAAAAFEQAAAVAGGGSAAPFLREAARRHAGVGDEAAAERSLRAAVAADPAHLPSVMAVRRSAARRRELAETVEACAFEAGVLRGAEARVSSLLRAAELARHLDPAGVPPQNRHARALGLFRQALEVDPANEVAFAGLRALLEENEAHGVLAEALAARITVARNPFEITALRLARAELLAGPLADRAAAKRELETILQKEPQHARALARLSDLEYEDGAFGTAGELYLRRAIVERAPELLREILLRLGRIYTKHVPDAKRAAGAYARVVQTEPDNHEALSALSDLYVETGETKNALAVTESLLAHEREPARRLEVLVRCGQLHERVGDLRQAGARFRQAADEAPRDYAAVSELARFLERTRDVAGRRALLDHSVGLLRHDVERGRFDLQTLRALVPLLQARGKTRAAAAAAQLLGAVSEDEAEGAAARGWAAPPPRGRRLAALARPEIDERTFPPALLPGMRHVFRLAGPFLAKGAPDLASHGLARGDRLARGQAARDVVDGVAAELGVPDVEVFVLEQKRGGAPSGRLCVEPGDRPAVIFPAELPALGGHALRFAAARSLRLVGTHLDLVLAATPAAAGALLAAIIRQFVPEFRHPGVRDDVLDGEAERVAKVLPRKLKPELTGFAVESAGAFDLEALHAAVRDGANAVGLLACGDLPAALAAVLAGWGLTLAPADLCKHPEALALLRFGLSDDYDDLSQSME